MLKKQIRLYYLFNFINRFMLYFPIFVIFLKSKGFSQTDIMVLMTFYNIAILVGEIPTGVFADKISRKYSVIIGCFMQAVGIGLMVYLNNFLWFIVLEMVFGIGITFQSGALSAMMYDFLKENNEEEKFAKVEGRKWTAIFSSQGIASILGGWLARVSLITPVLLTSLAFGLSGVILLFFKESPIHNKKDFKYLSHVKETFLTIFRCKGLKVLLLIFIFTQTLFMVTMWLYQPYFKAIGIPIFIFGFVYFLINTSSATGGYFSGNLTFSKITIILLYIGSAVIPILLMGYVNSYLLGILFPCIVFFSLGMFSPHISKYWNSLVPSGQRATAGSILSLAAALLFALVGPGVGVISDRINIFEAFKIPSFLYLIIIIAVLIYGMDTLKKSDIEEKSVRVKM